MAKFDVSALTLNPTEVSEVSEVIVEQAFVNGNLSSIHDIQTGISHKEQILFLSRMGIGGKALTNCTPAEIAGLNFTEKFWNPALVAGRFTHCANDENGLFKILKQASNVYPEFFNRLDSQELKLVVALMLTHMEESIQAKVWFSDTDADDYDDTNSTGTGVFTNGTDFGVFNQFEGLFKQIFADSAIPKYAITQNTGNSYANQTITDAQAFAIIKNVWANADSRLKSQADGQILVTSDIYYGYLNHIETTEGSGGITSMMVDGVNMITYRGVPVINMEHWTRNITEYQNNGTKLNLPHRAVYTTPGNIPIGTLSQSDLQNLRSIFDEVNNENIIDYGYFLDAKFGESYMASVAY